MQHLPFAPEDIEVPHQHGERCGAQFENGGQQVDLTPAVARQQPEMRGDDAQAAVLRLNNGIDRTARLQPADAEIDLVGDADRSEAHTSELQSLMRISYA